MQVLHVKNDKNNALEYQTIGVSLPGHGLVKFGLNGSGWMTVLGMLSVCVCVSIDCLPFFHSFVLPFFRIASVCQYGLCSTMFYSMSVNSPAHHLQRN